jgi:hypothetical protein
VRGRLLAIPGFVASVMALGCSIAPPAPTPPTGPACGVERWPVKTLTDPAAIRVDLANVIPTTIAALNDLRERCTDLPEERTFAEEFRVYEVVGVVQFTRDEGDRDVHLALADPADPAKTIVVEIVDPACAAASPMLTTFSNARLRYQSFGSLAGRQVRVRGVGFYDFAHGQVGRSDSCFELHPVLNLSPR